jgi:hypothetical protein
MNPLRSRAITCALGALALAASTVVFAAPASAASEPCTIIGATLDWGFKESFRAYIDGSIANGEWTTAGGASYATPTFTWSDGTVVIDPEARTIEATFTGSVRFTGHDGLLDTTIADPVVQVAAGTSTGGTGTIFLDVSGPTMEGDPIEVDDAPFVSGGVAAGSLDVHDPQTVLLVAPALTEEGATAFPNYEVGAAFDDALLTIPTTDDCRIPTSQGDSTGIWVATGLAAAGVLAILGATLVILRRRKQVPNA